MNNDLNRKIGISEVNTLIDLLMEKRWIKNAWGDEYKYYYYKLKDISLRQKKLILFLIFQNNDDKLKEVLKQFFNNK